MFRFALPLFLSLMLASPLLAAEEKTAKVDAAPATAAAPTAPKEPDISSVLFMQNLKNIGAKIFYLGEQLGLHGWFVVKDKQVQILYTTPDNKALLVGALLSAEGANISQQQVLTLASGNPEVQALLRDSSAKAKENEPSSEVSKLAQTKDSAAVASPSEQFYLELLKAAGHTFGKAEAPLLIMIMDVNCPFCHQTWKQLEPLVESEKIRVRMVPINALGGESLEKAAAWLSSKDPLGDWKKYISGASDVFIPSTDHSEKQTAVFDTTDLAKKWGVDQTPYLLYRGRGGKMRLIVGKPHNIDAVLGDIENIK